MASILVTGFGRFPGATRNPTVALVARLGRVRRPALSDCRIATHVFATRYAAVDRELPDLIAREKPDLVMLFGVARKEKRLRIELVARNRTSVLLPDAGGAKPTRGIIAAGGPASRMGRFSPHPLLAAIRAIGLRAGVSRNAGAYLCNYAYWRALEAADRTADGPRIAVFVHVPPIPATARPKKNDGRNTRRPPSIASLTRAG